MNKWLYDVYGIICLIPLVYILQEDSDFSVQGLLDIIYLILYLHTFINLVLIIMNDNPFIKSLYLISDTEENITAYTADDSDSFKTIVVFECRGVEPVEFSPRVNFLVYISHIINILSLNERSSSD